MRTTYCGAEIAKIGEDLGKLEALHSFRGYGGILCVAVKTVKLDDECPS